MAKKIKDVSDLPGVGEKVGEKLKKAGYIDLMSLAAASPKELGETANIGELTATKIINKAREELDIGFEKATEIYKRRQNIKRISTGSKNLDELLGGGVETQAVVELHGAFGSGKTQVGFQLAVNAQKPEKDGGINGNCVFLDAESTFRPDRIKQIAEAEGMDPKKVMERIYVARCYNSDHQMIMADKIGEMIKEKNIKLVIIDSVTSNFRADFSGRGELQRCDDLGLRPASRRSCGCGRHLGIWSGFSRAQDISPWQRANQWMGTQHPPCYPPSHQPGGGTG